MAPEPTSSGGAPKPKKKIPTWYYVAGAGALIVAYYAYSKSQASKAAAAAASSTAPIASGGGTAAGSYGNAGDLAALAPYLNSVGSSSTSGASTTNAPFALPSGENFIGSGYGFNPSAQNDPSNPYGVIPSQTAATSTSGASYVEVSQGDLAQLIAGGQQVYYQPAPGVFTALPPGATAGNLQGLVGTTPLFISQPQGASA